MRGGAGRETEGWADSGRPRPTAFRAVGRARRRLGGARARRPPARIGRALATPLRPNSSSVNPAWAGQEVRGQVVAQIERPGGLPALADQRWASKPGAPRSREPGVWKRRRSLLRPPSSESAELQTSSTHSGEGVVYTSQILEPNF